MKLLISACLLGEPCRYDGKSKGLDLAALAALTARYELIPVCPEVMGGLPTPRVPAEQLGPRVVNAEGEDVTEAYHRGAAAAVAAARQEGCLTALLKQRSPSCGSGTVYDGSFTRRLRPGDGVAAQALRQAGVQVWSEEELAALLDTAEKS